MTQRPEQAPMVAREAGGTGAAQIAGAGLRYLTVFFTTRILGAASFGAYALALTIVALGQLLSVLGLSPGVLPFVARARKDGGAQVRAVVRAALLIVVGSSLLLASAVFLVAPWLGQTVFGKPGLSAFLRPLSALIAVGALSTVVLSLLQGFMAVKESAWIERVLAVGVTLAGVAVTWWAGWGAPGVVVAAIAGPAAGLLAGGALLGSRAPGAFGRSFATAPLPTLPLLAYSWPLWGSTMLTFVLLWMDILLMGVFRDSQEVGVYGLCARLAPAIVLVQESVGPVFNAQLSRLFLEKDWESIRRLYRFTTRWAIWPAHSIGWVLVLWGAPVLSVFGGEFTVGSAALVVLVAAKAVSASGGHCGKMLAMTNKAGLNLVNTGIAVAVNLGLNLVWIPRFGAVGAAAATCCCLVLSKALQIVEVWVCYRMLPWDRRGLAGVGVTAVLAAAVYPFREGLPGAWGWLLPLGSYVVAAIAAYLVLGIGEEDRAVWRAMRRRISSRRSA